MAKSLYGVFVVIFVSLLLSANCAAADKPSNNSIIINMGDEQKAGKPLAPPVYLSELSNINDYNIFANGGWDGSWYVGYNVCWIEMLPAAPNQLFRKAYIGAKLGRMKTQSVPKKPIWEKEPIAGEIYMAVSSSPSWKASQSYFLTNTKDIPYEADPENGLEGVGESRWFWAEVPINEVNFSGPNYVTIFSPTPYFVSTASSAVIAGGWGSKKVNTWLNSDIKGSAPLDPKNSLKTAITVFEPAIAMKLVPAGTEQEIYVKITDIKEGRENTANKTLIAEVLGSEIEKAWLEISQDKTTWEKHGFYAYNSPYMFTLKADKLPAGKVFVRCVAVDAWGNTGESQVLEISVTR